MRDIASIVELEVDLSTIEGKRLALKLRKRFGDRLYVKRARSNPFDPYDIPRVLGGLASAHSYEMVNRLFLGNRRSEYIKPSFKRITEDNAKEIYKNIRALSNIY